MTERTDDIDILITRVLSGEATPEERHRLEDWLRKPANAAYYDKAKRAFALAEKHVAKGKENPVVNVDEEWTRFTERVGQKGGRVRQLSTGFTWMRVAAALLVIVAAGFVINYFVTQTGETRFETLAETKQIDLPDGSVVTLNRNSALSYKTDFNGEQRAVQLEGEAFFDVASNKEKPFIITMGATRVEVVGTSFNVSAYDQDTQITVTVTTGLVRFSAASSTSTVDIKPGEVGIFSKAAGSLTSSANDDVNYRAWTTRHIEFNGTPLREVVRTLNRTYGANITITTTIPDTCFVTVTFDQQTLDAVLRVLETTLNLTYRVNGESIEITSAGC